MSIDFAGVAEDYEDLLDAAGEEDPELQEREAELRERVFSRYGFKYGGVIYVSREVGRLLALPESKAVDFSGNLLNRPELVDERMLPTLVSDGYEVRDLD